MDTERVLHFIDAEFTGLDPAIHELISIGIVTARQSYLADGIKFTELGSEEIRLKPETPETADPTAFEINGYSEEGWKDAYSQKEGLQIISEKLTAVDSETGANMALIAGHNVHNDIIFLNASFIKYRIPHKLNKYAVDTHSIGSALLIGKDDVRSISLSGMSEYFGIENENAHNALSDAKTTFEVYKRLLALAGHNLV